MKSGEFKQLRRLAGLTQEQAARELAVTHRTVLRWEHGDSNIHPLKAVAIKSCFLKFVFSDRKRNDAETV